MNSIFSKVIFCAGLMVLAGVALVGAVAVFAQDNSFDGLVYPIEELGNCQNKAACAAYCDKDENMGVCLDFAEENSLMPQEEIAMGRKMLAKGQTRGPGGCKGQAACETYCDQIDNIRECIKFAQENDLIPADELEEAKKVIQAMDRGINPPNCKGKKECDVFCSEPENMESCIEFAKEAGLMPPEELEEADKVLSAIKKGAKPPACRGREECDVYCSGPEHMRECMEFALAAGFMPPEEIENARKTLKAIEQGIKPPNCRGKEECDVYCSGPEHMLECMEFGIAAGFIPAEQAENARKTLEAIKKGIMPPACSGEEECQAYCKQPEHMAECMEFSIAAGFMPAEDAENAKKSLEAIKRGVMPPACSGEEECEAYCRQPEHTEECINFSEAAGFMSSEDAERARQGMREGSEGGPREGPGGCKTQEECMEFCQNPENLEECQQFMPSGGSEQGQGPGLGEPGGPGTGNMAPPPGGWPEGVQPAGVPGEEGEEGEFSETGPIQEETREQIEQRVQQQMQEIQQRLNNLPPEYQQMPEVQQQIQQLQQIQQQIPQGPLPQPSPEPSPAAPSEPAPQSFLDPFVKFGASIIQFLK